MYKYNPHICLFQLFVLYEKEKNINWYVFVNGNIKISTFESSNCWKSMGNINNITSIVWSLIVSIFSAERGTVFCKTSNKYKLNEIKWN